MTVVKKEKSRSVVRFAIGLGSVAASICLALGAGPACTMDPDPNAVPRADHNPFQWEPFQYEAGQMVFSDPSADFAGESVYVGGRVYLANESDDSTTSLDIHRVMAVRIAADHKQTAVLDNGMEYPADSLSYVNDQEPGTLVQSAFGIGQGVFNERTLVLHGGDLRTTEASKAIAQHTIASMEIKNTGEIVYTLENGETLAEGDTAQLPIFNVGEYVLPLSDLRTASILKECTATNACEDIPLTFAAMGFFAVEQIAFSGAGIPSYTLSNGSVLAANDLLHLRTSWSRAEDGKVFEQNQVLGSYSSTSYIGQQFGIVFRAYAQGRGGSYAYLTEVYSYDASVEYYSFSDMHYEAKAYWTDLSTFFYLHRDHDNDPSYAYWFNEGSLLENNRLPAP